jgi:hypothetical protein
VRDHEGAGCWCLAEDATISYECERAAHVPCRWCNDEGVVHTHDGEIIGPCECGPLVLHNDGRDDASTA